MQLQLFNVGHGSCALLIADNGNVALFDCGHDDEIGFRPSRYLRANNVTGIERLVISHYDEDHVSDLADLRRVLPIETVVRNRSVAPEQIQRLKGGALTPGIQALLDLTSAYTADVARPPVFANVEFATFDNRYPSFQDTNNLSVVSFIHHTPTGTGIVLPGDIERPGWEALLADARFREHLARVNILVASHHGRENGYAERVFDYCSPDIVIISDTAIQHDTQANRYAQHARGIPWDNGASTRYVLTTRRDGDILITTDASGYHIATQR